MTLYDYIPYCIGIACCPIVAGPSDLEFLIISVSNHASSCKYHVGLFYRPPSSGVQSLESLYSYLGSLDSSYFSNFVLVGDFNIDFYNHSHFLYSRLTGILHSFSLHQVVEDHTHISPTGNTSLIDLALVSNLPQLQKYSIVPPLANSDHLGLDLTMKWRRIRRPATRVVWKYAQADFTKASTQIDVTNWDTLFTDDINESLTNWQTRFMEIIEECVSRKVLPKRRNLPWMTINLTRAMRKRNHLFRRVRNSGSSSIFNRYKEVRNKVVQELRGFKRKYFRKLNPSNPMQFWKTVKLMSKSYTSIPVLERNGVTATKASDKATMFNQYFSECFNMAQPPLSSTNRDDFEVTSESPLDFMCTEEEVFRMLTLFTPYKTA